MRGINNVLSVIHKKSFGVDSMGRSVREVLSAGVRAPLNFAKNADAIGLGDVKDDTVD